MEYAANAGPFEDEVGLRVLIGERIREEFIEITVEDPDLRLVTCIEVLSPTNKRKGSDGWKEYLRPNKKGAEQMEKNPAAAKKAAKKTAPDMIPPNAVGNDVTVEIFEATESQNFDLKKPGKK